MKHIQKMADNTTAEQKKAAEAVNEKKEETSPAPTKKEASTDDKSGKAESTSTNSETNNNSPPRVSLPPLTEDGRHRLETAWTFWYDKKDRSKDYEENLQPMGTFDTVEDFFRYVAPAMAMYKIWLLSSGFHGLMLVCMCTDCTLTLRSLQLCLRTPITTSSELVTSRCGRYVSFFCLR